MARDRLIADIRNSSTNNTDTTEHPQDNTDTTEHPQVIVGEAVSEAVLEESQFVNVRVELLSGAVIVEELKVPLSISILNLKAEIERREGTPASRQQLIFDCNVLDDKSTFEELGFENEVTLSLIRRATLQFIWDVSELLAAGPLDDLVLKSPSFQVGNDNQSVTIEYYPRGCQDNVLRKRGMCSVFLTRPDSSLLRCRLSVGEHSRESLFTFTHGQTGWTNFCEQLQEQPRSLVLDVMHFGMVERPVVHEESASWDLRSAIGGMPFVVGQQIKSPIVTLPGDVQVTLVFFPGGKSNAPAYHTSLWVLPIRNLFDRRYRCTVDGCAKIGTGESMFHFPRPEEYGNVDIQLLAEGVSCS